MEELTLETSLMRDAFNFTYNGVYFNANNRVGVIKFYYGAVEGFISPLWISTYADSLTVNTSLTVEFKVNQDGQTFTTGQIPIPFRRWTQRNVTVYDYKSATPSSTYRLNFPWSDGRLVTIHIIVRADNIIQTDTTFQTASPINLSVSSFSQTPQTGKVCAATLTNDVVNNTYWKLTEPFRVYGYHDTSVGSEWYGISTYLDNGITAVEAEDSGFDTFYFYLPYFDGKNHSDNSGIITATFTIQTVDLYTPGTYSVEAKYRSNFSFSYVDQSDAGASPAISNLAVAANPSDIVTRFGKYVGGNITELTFSWNAAFRYGSSFLSVTYNLYDYDGTLMNTWSYDFNTNLVFTLPNTVDSSQYVTVTVVDSNLVASTATYTTFQVFGYVNPSILSLNASRCDQDGTPNDSGEYCKITYQFRITPLNNLNQKEITLIAPDGTHVYTNLDYNHGSPYQYISPANPDLSYVITITVEDDFVSVSQSMNLSTAGVIMDFYHDGKGIGLGKVAETSKMVEVNPEWTFKADKILFKGEDLETILTSLGYVFPT